MTKTMRFVIEVSVIDDAPSDPLQCADGLMEHATNYEWPEWLFSIDGLDPHFPDKRLRDLVVAYINAHRGTDTHYSLEEETDAFVALAAAVGMEPRPVTKIWDSEAGEYVPMIPTVLECPPHDFDLLRQCRKCGLGSVRVDDE